MEHWLSGTPLAAIPGATVAALIAGTLLPLLGVWVVYQRIVFLGVTLAQVAAAGVALGLLLDLPPLPMGFLLCAIMVALVVRGFRGGLGSGGDSALGAAFCVASALALLFISRSPAELEEIEHVLHGNLIYALPGDVQRVTLALVAGLVVIGLCFHRILFSAFDGETAAALGLRPRGWLLLLFLVLAVVLTLSMSTTGSLLTSALLILPPLAALQFRRGLMATFALASLLGFLATLGGLLLAVTADLHLESSIVVSSFLLLPLVACWRLSPLLAIALTAALCFLAPRLAPQPAPPVPEHVTPSASAAASDLPPDVLALLAEDAANADPTSGIGATPGAGSTPGAAPPMAPPGSAGTAGSAATAAVAATDPGATLPLLPHHLSLVTVHLFAQPATAPAAAKGDPPAAPATAAGASSGATAAAPITAIEVSWTLDVRRGSPPRELPRALWLRTTGCGVSDERVLVRDTAQLPPGDQLRTGDFVLTGITSVGPLAGQLWTGPAADPNATPVPDSTVFPSTAPAAHGHP